MSYDAIVIGAGISGAATAYHLRKAGAKTLLIERGEPASGGTGKSAAIIRQSYSTPLLVRLARASITMFENAKAELGSDAGFVQDGYCFVVSADMLEGAKKNVAMQKGLGIVNEWSDGPGFPQHLPETQSRRHRGHRLRAAWRLRRPRAGDRGLCGGIHECRRGIPRAHAGAATVAAGRPRHGCRTRQWRGERQPVVNAAGPWAKPLAESAGLDLTMRSVREQDTVWQIPAGRKIRKTSISMGVDAVYYRPLGQDRFIIGRGFPKEYADVDPYNYKTAADGDFISDVQTRVERRFPSFAGMKLIEAYAALYDVTPDWYPFVGPRAGIVGYADFSGGSGHGFKIAPAIGRELAEWLLTGQGRGRFPPVQPRPRRARQAVRAILRGQSRLGTMNMVPLHPERGRSAWPVCFRAETILGGDTEPVAT